MKNKLVIYKDYIEMHGQQNIKRHSYIYCVAVDCYLWATCFGSTEPQSGSL
jgi:hypothetical protein